MEEPRAEPAEVALLLEGTYPYVSGGVSSWVHQIVQAFPRYRFALVFLGSRPEDYGEMRYRLPGNVVRLDTHYIHGGHAAPVVRRTEGAPGPYELVRALHESFRAKTPLAPDLLRRLMDTAGPDGIEETSFLYSRSSWRYISDQYRNRSTDPSFIDYFWTVRIMHQPIWRLARLAETLPPARAYHAVSTGYAGFLGTLLRRRHGRPLILSEHGIYTKERKIDLFQSEWIRDNRDVMVREPAEVGYLKQLWIRFFESLGRLCYDAADPIVALYEANRLRQVEDGADPARTRNVPNGIDIARFLAARSARPARLPPVLCLVGRVVPIKDVKTFLRAMRIVVNRMPDAQGWIAGPADEDKPYVEECVNLAGSLGLSAAVRFLGFQKMEELLPKIGVLVLSSISEGLPLVILEAHAGGVPAVATDVGSCRQLIEGLDAEDRALGASGRIVGIADPEALAAAALGLLGDAGAWRAAQQAGIARVERYYAQETMIARYREIYEAALAGAGS
jgi:glycosyltransferase involved in cell wall biosynthesis